MAEENELEDDQQDLFEKALAIFSKRKYKEALPLFEQISHPNMEVLKYYYLGLTHIHLGHFDKGLTAYRKIREVPAKVSGVEYDKLMYGLYINMGSALQVLGRKHREENGQKLLEEAITCYEYALQLQDYDPRVHNNIGNAYLDLKQYPKAIQNFNKALELDDEYPEAYYCLSLAYEFSEMYDLAIEKLEKGLHWKRKNKTYLNRLAALHFGLKHFEKAKEYGERALAVDPENKNALKSMALILYNMEQYSEAYGYYEKIKQQDPEFNEPEIMSIFKDLESRIKSK